MSNKTWLQEYQQVPPPDPRPVIVVGYDRRECLRLLRANGIREHDRGVVLVNMKGDWWTALAGRRFEDYRYIGATEDDVRRLWEGR